MKHWILYILLTSLIGISNLYGEKKHPINQDSLSKEQDTMYRFLKKKHQNKIMWGCYSDGETSYNTFAFFHLIKYKRTDLITKLLYSRTPANRYLASVALIVLKDQKIIEIDSATSKRINKLKRSHRRIWFCSGCTSSGYSSMKNCYNFIPKVNVRGKKNWGRDYYSSFEFYIQKKDEIQ